MSVDAVQASQVEPAKLIYWALDCEVLTPSQAMTCCLAIGEQGPDGLPFSLGPFLVSRGWVSQEGFEALVSSYMEQDASPALKEVDPLSVLATIQQTIQEIDADWISKSGDLETPNLIQARSVESFAALSTDGQLKRRQTAEFGSNEGHIQLHGEGLVPAADVDSVDFASQDLPSAVSLVNIAAWDPALQESERYMLGRELGRGGLGIVIEARDMRLGRKVARKSLLRQNGAGSEEVESFMSEARVTGQLEHPNIMPVYDFGRDDDGDLFYTMRLMPQNTLEQARDRGELGVLQFVKILQQICMGLAYAHSRGVVHRDIKPANILLGHFGEVLILDWGIAKVLRDNEPKDTETQRAPGVLHTKKLRGTPAYMAPELIKEGRISPSIDQYAIGVMLYEYLTGRLPFFSDSLYTLLFQICSQPPVPPVEVKTARPVSEELSQICMQMMSKSPDDRFPSCRAVYDRLEEYLEGSRETQRRHELAQERIAEATQLVRDYHLSRDREQGVFDAWETAKMAIEPWDDIEKKRPVWTREQEYKSLRERGVSLFGEAIQKFTQALEHEPGNADARRGMAELYWSKFEEAERDNDQLAKIQYRDLVRFHDDGTYARLFEGTGSLHVTTQPGAAEVALFRYEEQDRRLIPMMMQHAGETPFELALPMGSYLLQIRKEGYRDVSLPVMLGRCESLSLSVNLYTDEEIGEEYVYVPGGRYIFGGNPDAMMAVPAQEIEVDDFFIARHPVTFGEFCTFLNEQRAIDPALAREMIPRNQGQEDYAVWTEERGYAPKRSNLFHGPIEERYPKGMGHEERVPVFGISWLDAVRYCRWRSECEGRTVLLPTEHEWEKAARGADMRIFPWGSHFEANFCKMGHSRPREELQPEPIGAFPLDQSPYGMQDVTGTIGEWMKSVTDDVFQSIEENPEEFVMFRGGGWVASNVNSMQICNRVLRNPASRSYNVGFRVVTFPKRDPV